MLKKVLLSFIILLGVLCFTVFIIVWIGKSELRQQKQAYHDAGFSLDPEDFILPEIPDEINAAVAYEPIFTFLANLSGEEQFLLGDERRINEPAMKALLIKCAPTIAALYAATDMQECRWDIRFDVKRGYVRKRSIHDLINAARLLETDLYANRARAESLHENRDDFIIRDIESILKLGRHVGTDPTAMGQMMASGILDLGIRLYEESFSDHSAPTNEVYNILAGVDMQEKFHQAMQEYITSNLRYWSGIIESAALVRDEDIELPWYAGYVVNWDQAYYLSEMRVYLDDFDTPVFNDAPLPNAPWYAPTFYEVGDTSRSFKFMFARDQLRIEMLRTAEQLRAYKTEYGAYPEVGVMEMPIDPTTGQRLKYEIVDEGFVLTGYCGIPDKPEFHWFWEN